MPVQNMIRHDSDDGPTWEGECERCGDHIERWRGDGDLTCYGCGAYYNSFGQRLRDDLYSRPNRSEWDENCSDLDGYEEAMLRDERD